MEEKQNCIQTLVNKGRAQFCYKKQKMESYIRLLHVEKTNTAEENISEDYAKKELITRIARWALQLEEFDYEIEHRAGSRMKHVDALSRYPVMMVCNDTLTSKLKKAQKEDDNIQTLKSLLEKQESEEFFEQNVDAFTKFTWLYPVKTVSAESALEKLKQQKTFGNPIRIISDRGSAFTSKLFNDYCDEENIQHLQIATGVPRGNGQVERIHRTLIPVLTKLSLGDSTKWSKYVDRLQRILNSTISRSTKWTPFELLVGIKMRNKEDILIKDLLLEEMAKELLEQREFLRNDAKKNIETLQSENRKTYNRRRKKAFRYTKKRPTNHCLFNTSRLYRIFAPCAVPPVLTSKNEKGLFPRLLKKYAPLPVDDSPVEIKSTSCPTNSILSEVPLQSNPVDETETNDLHFSVPDEGNDIDATPETDSSTKPEGNASVMPKDRASESTDMRIGSGNEPRNKDVRRDGPYIVLPQRSPTAFVVASCDKPDEPLGVYHTLALAFFLNGTETQSFVVPLKKRGRPRKQPLIRRGTAGENATSARTPPHQDGL
ncbi:hypothetical protein TNCV_4143611 [Trichonephila clavipes]|nr:hypothetical protein TNCV_4143611 [Trichonephila clavipes]